MNCAASRRSAVHKPDPIEDILARLMPPALSEEGQRGIEAMIDELAGESVPTPQIPALAELPVLGVVQSSWPRRMAAAGIAAAVAVLAATFAPSSSGPASDSVAAHDLQAQEELPPEFVLVSESDRIESTTDEGWVEDSEGSTMRALRLNVVEENNIRDEETGIVVRVSEPREEILLMPISAF